MKTSHNRQDKAIWNRIMLCVCLLALFVLATPVLTSFSGPVGMQQTGTQQAGTQQTGTQQTGAQSISTSADAGWFSVSPAMAEEVARAAAEGEAAEEDVIIAPQPQRKDYPDVGVSSRSIVWIIAQMHLYFAAFVLAVPIFVVLIEWIGLKTGNVQYENMAREFMKVSMTAYSITALFGGALALALYLLYPDFMAYMTHVFGAQLLVYAFLFFAESFFLYVYYYSWDALKYGNQKWVHLSLGLMLNAAGTTLMVVSNSWATFMMAPSGVNEVGAVVGIWPCRSSSY